MDAVAQPLQGALDEETRAREAAKRWKARNGKRKQRMQPAESGRIGVSDTPERLVARATRLRGQLAARALKEGSAPRRVQELIATAPRVSDVTEKLVERMIGATRDFLSVEFLERGLAASLCVGRIMTRHSVNGTGFLVAPDIVLTNHHVLWDEQTAGSSLLELDYEANTFGAPKRPQSFDLDPSGFFITDNDNDFTLVAVKPISQESRKLTDFGHLPLIAEEGKIAIGESVNIIQHPKGRIKQVVIRNSKLVDLPEGADFEAFFHYEADTEKGSSGSPVFSDQWEVVALHHAGVPATNSKGEMLDNDGNVVEQFDEEQIQWIANEGIRTSRIVKAVADAKLGNAAHVARRAGLLALWLSESKPGLGIPGAAERDGRATIQDKRIATPPESRRETDMRTQTIGGATENAAAFATPSSGHTVSFSVPLRVDISLGSVPSQAEAALLGRRSLQESVSPDPNDLDYERRPGFDPHFLGFAAPLPQLKNDDHGPLLTYGADSRGELKYHHFSILMNARRRLAYVSAVNIDADAPYQQKREGSDRWFFDRRIPAKLQAGGVYYASNPLDRGHLTRRDDAAWGETAEEAKLANDDTFHWTNCSPQHEIFNQSTLATRRGLKLWGNLENAISALAPTYGSRLSVFNGPIFNDSDRSYRDNFFIPEAYWKLIVLKGEDGKERALAFQLSQSEELKDLVSERFAPDALKDFEVFQVAVAALEAATRLDFGPIPSWDALTQQASLKERATVSAALVRSEADIRI